MSKVTVQHDAQGNPSVWVTAEEPVEGLPQKVPGARELMVCKNQHSTVGNYPCEAVAILEDRRWTRMDANEAKARMIELARWMPPAAREALLKCKTVLEAMAEEGMVEHQDEDCPEDDTCTCAIISLFNEAHAAATAALKGSS